MAAGSMGHCVRVIFALRKSAYLYVVFHMSSRASSHDVTEMSKYFKLYWLSSIRKIKYRYPNGVILIDF